MSKLIRKSHNVSVLLYHYVCPAKYRKAVIDEEVDQVLKEICLEIAARYEMEFIEIGTNKDCIHCEAGYPVACCAGSTLEQNPTRRGKIS